MYSFVAIPSSQKRYSLHKLNGIRGFRTWLESKFPDAVHPISQSQDQETFDHVLIDLNQFLHTIVRNSRTEGHGLVLLMKELDQLIQMATPTKSLVLAIDGPPSAAKLATQRQRRLEKCIKAERTLQQLEHSPRRVARKKRSVVADLRTLPLTPSTKFMTLVEQALLYWAWQRLSNRNSCLPEGVHVYISPSTVPGEGEVKLLEWMYRHTSHPHQINESVAFLGGDADLVLEGLMLNRPNVFCVLPHGRRQYSCVSVWQLTRALARDAGVRSLDMLPQRRLDWVLLILLNGNDYVPKLRGSSGFYRLFQAYEKVLGRHPNGSLVDVESLEFHLDICLDLFQELSRNVTPFGDASASATMLQKLHHYSAAGYLPQPIKLRVVKSDVGGENDESNADGIDADRDDDEAVDYETDANFVSELDEDVAETGNDDAGYVEGEDQDTAGKDEVVLQLGDPDSDDFYEFSVWIRRGQNLKRAKQHLATMALRELLDDEEEENMMNGTKEKRKMIECDVPLYLYGLLWTLQTYQDGTCADYGYQYGEGRLSPTAKDVVDYFEQAKATGQTIGVSSLRKGFTPPVAAGIACLATLPSQAKEYIPEPYKYLDDEFVDSTYQNCVNETALTFDMKRFEELCNKEVNERAESDDRFHVSKETQSSASSAAKERRIIMGDHSWTVLNKQDRSLVHPFHPPEPFLDRLSELWQSNYIQAQRITAASSPRLRSVWNETAAQEHQGFASKSPKVGSVGSTDVSGVSLLGNGALIEDVKYNVAYRRKLKTAKKTTTRNEFPKARDIQNSLDSNKEMVASRTDVSKLKKVTPVSLRDGVTALACLKQLEDACYIGRIQWSAKKTSPNDALQAENWKLVIHKGGCLIDKVVFQGVREPKMTKQCVKHNLSSQALTHMFGGDDKWANLSFKELRSLIKAQVPLIE